MKIAAVLLFISLFSLSIGCSRNNADNTDYGDTDDSAAAYAVHNDNGDSVLDIEGPDFAAQIQEIQSFRDGFLGQTIRYEGTFLSSYWQGETLYFIGRLEGSCCGFYGFEVYLNEIPPVDDETWVEVTGVLEEFFADDIERYILRLNVVSLYER